MHEAGGDRRLLRREGLYTSHLTAWRKQRKAASQLLRAEGISLDRAHTHVEGATTRGNLFRRAPATDDLRALLDGAGAARPAPVTVPVSRSRTCCSARSTIPPGRIPQRFARSACSRTRSARR